jgi:signal transduction histidine kinase
MFAVIAAGNLMYNIERERRKEAVEAEKARARENLELQKKAQEAELAAQAERDRIAREIHDGIAQSIYALSLNLETCAEVADKEQGPLAERLRELVPLAKKTLLESRHYIFDLKPLLSGETGMKAVAESLVKEFRVVSGNSVHLTTTGEPRDLSVAAASGLYRILQEALANVFKHAGASGVTVALDFRPATVSLSVEDNGVGFDADGAVPGFGLENMRLRVSELAGTFEISGAPGEGTKISVTLPAAGGEA